MIWVAYPVAKTSLVTLPCVKSGLIIAYRLFNIECKIFCIRGRVYTPTLVCQGRENGGKSKIVQNCTKYFRFQPFPSDCAQASVCPVFEFQVCTIDRADECARCDFSRRMQTKCKTLDCTSPGTHLRLAPED
jgi:hypothetical protein